MLQKIQRIYRSTTQRFMSITFLGMMVGLGLDVLIAAYFGLTGEADAVIVALTLPLLIDVVLREGTKFSLVPLFVRMREEGTATYHCFVSSMHNLLIVVGALIGVAIYLMSSWVITLIGPGLDEVHGKRAVEMLRLAVPSVSLAFGIAILTVFLNAQKQLLVIAMRNMVIPMFAIIFLVYQNLGGNSDTRLIVGYVSGFFAYFSILFLFSYRAGFKYSILAWPKRSWFRELFRNMGFPLFGFLLRQVLRVVERVIASTLMPGAVVAYYLAYRLYSALVNLIGSSVATTSVSTLSEQAVKGSVSKLSSHFMRSIKVLLSIGIFVTLIIFMFGLDITKLVYGYGDFDISGVVVTSDVLKWMSLSLAFSLQIPLLQTVAFIDHQHAYVFSITLLVVVVNIILAVWLAGPYGIIGIAAAGAISIFIEYVLLIVLSRKFLQVGNIRGV